MSAGYFGDPRATSRRISGVRFVVLGLIAVLATACGSAEPSVGPARYGISLDVPDGTSAEVSRGMIRISTGDLSVVLYEYEPQAPGEATYFDDRWPVQLETADFRQLRPGTGSEDDARLVSVAGRFFSVFPEGDQSAAPTRQLEALNDALAAIEVEPGDFYPGWVQPVEFPKRPGWHVVSSGPTPRYAYGEYVQTAAATIPYRNGPNDLPPVRTLEALPRDGIVVWIGLTRDAHFSPSRLGRDTAFEPKSPPPYRLADLERVDGWEGQVRDIPDYRPTKTMLDEADAVLRELRLPDWGPWELERWHFERQY
jgi:hypothetical protein